MKAAATSACRAPFCGGAHRCATISLHAPTPRRSSDPATGAAARRLAVCVCWSTFIARSRHIHTQFVGSVSVAIAARLWLGCSGVRARQGTGCARCARRSVCGTPTPATSGTRSRRACTGRGEAPPPEAAAARGGGGGGSARAAVVGEADAGGARVAAVDAAAARRRRRAGARRRPSAAAAALRRRRVAAGGGGGGAAGAHAAPARSQARRRRVARRRCSERPPGLVDEFGAPLRPPHRRSSARARRAANVGMEGAQGRGNASAYMRIMVRVSRRRGTVKKAVTARRPR